MRFRELLLIGVLCAVLILQVAPGAEKASETTYERFRRFVTVLEQVKRHYVTPVDDDKLFLGAYKGMLAELDPYSQFLTKTDVEQLEIDTEGEFGGLGIEITLDERRVLTVITPLEDTPAMKAGVLPGDRIVEIEGRSTYGITLLDAVQKLRGRPGTKVTITVIHQLTGKREKLTITRDVIKVKSVRAAHMVDEKAKVGYIRMNNFQRSTPQELDEAVKKLLAQGMRALVLDLRRNPGGLLDSAAAVADRFINKGVIVTTRGRTPETVHRFEAHEEGTYPDFPLAVLVSSYTASGSEIVAGAVRDHHRGIIVGSRTFGKGSVQSILSLAGGAKLRLTTAYYYTPSGRCIHRQLNAKPTDPWGIMPDIEVKTTFEDELALGEHFRKERIVENTHDEKAVPPPGGEAEKKEEFVDKALVRAVDALKAILVYRSN